MSPTTGSARPPAASICLAALNTVPSSLGCGSAVLAISATLAPSRAARSAIARPMPRLPPEMNKVLPASVTEGLLSGVTPGAGIRPVRQIKIFFPNEPGFRGRVSLVRLRGVAQAAAGRLDLDLGGRAVGPGGAPDALARFQFLV